MTESTAMDLPIRKISGPQRVDRHGHRPGGQSGDEPGFDVDDQPADADPQGKLAPEDETHTPDPDRPVAPRDEDESGSGIDVTA